MNAYSPDEQARFFNLLWADPKVINVKVHEAEIPYTHEITLFATVTLLPGVVYKEHHTLRRWTEAGDEVEIQLAGTIKTTVENFQKQLKYCFCEGCRRDMVRWIAFGAPLKKSPVAYTKQEDHIWVWSTRLLIDKGMQ